MDSGPRSASVGACVDQYNARSPPLLVPQPTIQHICGYGSSPFYSRQPIAFPGSRDVKMSLENGVIVIRHLYGFHNVGFVDPSHGRHIQHHIVSTGKSLMGVVGKNAGEVVVYGCAEYFLYEVHWKA